jgi:FkbM family methyltransferase
VTENLTFARGLWIPSHDVDRFLTFPEVEGLPNADIKKMREAIGHCPTRGVAIDVGAHIGVVSLFLARHFQEVHSFEPCPETYEALTRNTSDQPNVEPHNCGLNDAGGTLRFEYLPSHGQLSHVLYDHETRKWPDSVITEPVPVRTIDSFEFPEVSFIKIDTEGFEGPVVKGARETILRCKPTIILEQWGNETLFHGWERNEASHFLESLGMRPTTGLSFKKDQIYRFPA